MCKKILFELIHPNSYITTAQALNEFFSFMKIESYDFIFFSFTVLRRKCKSFCTVGLCHRMCQVGQWTVDTGIPSTQSTSTKKNKRTMKWFKCFTERSKRLRCVRLRANEIQNQFSPGPNMFSFHFFRFSFLIAINLNSTLLIELVGIQYDIFHWVTMMVLAMCRMNSGRF